MNTAPYSGMAGGAWTPPAPQLLKDVLMLIVGYRADPDVLAQLLPPGLEPHPSGLIQMNMYECPDPAQTSGFGAFSLTYLTVEIAGHDSQTADGTMSIPGRYWVGYWNSSPRVRTYAREQAGIPALPGECTWTLDGDRLLSRLSVDGTPAIEVTARVGTEEIGVLGGHLNYYTHREIPAPAGGTNAISELLEIPIPFVAHLRNAEVEDVTFRFRESSPFARLAPNSPLEIGGVLHGKVTFTYSMARRVVDYLA
ncbi:acetoacetate decarboxylase family protein [Pseudonocardia asaccharolytica]|uniref:Acetoacetate decarboxylase n=1 Tax=Pseudonocardia asaccharolytica DSM 44247 = NBRC 16224 TaxID=1123024 RepID=A0A511D6L2_9PSEU|nr:acetoacetate decarboxylase family protein [Pseudonocardia asaccharolytica]GEL20429.1 hypothetical protein PA7_42660 [Pseudonocardia asaccharolytica DSM 44247 = NBRC 16224]